MQRLSNGLDRSKSILSSALRCGKTGEYPAKPVSPDDDVLKSVDLRGRGYVVIGAGQGIGAATCRALAGSGARLLCVDNDIVRGAHADDRQQRSGAVRHSLGTRRRMVEAHEPVAGA